MRPTPWIPPIFCLTLLCSTCTTALGTLIDFESIASETLVRDQFLDVGLRVEGAGAFSGRVYSEGSYGVVNFGNSSTQIMDIGAREQPTTLNFVDPSDPGISVGVRWVSFLIGDGDDESETFVVTGWDADGSLLLGPDVTTTGTEPGRFTWFYQEEVSGQLARLELRVAQSSASGAVIDDLEFDLALAPTAVPQPTILEAAPIVTNIAPNPFNPVTQVTFKVPTPAHTRVRALDLRGRELATVFRGWGTGAEQSVPWYAGDLPSGTYLLRFESGTSVATRKIVLVR